jgi:hypothetical protein
MHLVARALPVIVAAVSGMAACAAPREGVHAANPVDVAYASAMTANELAKTKSQETVYGWNLEIVGDRARFFACPKEHACGERIVDVPAKSVLAVKHIGRAHPSRADGSELEETDVLLLTLAKDVTTSRGGVVADPQRGLTVGGPAKH